MGSRLTGIQRHDRIFVFILCGFLLIGAVRPALDPNPAMQLMVALPVLVSVMCIAIAGMHYLRAALLVSTVAVTGLELWLLGGRLGGWGHQKFWQAVLILGPFNVGIGIVTMVVSLLVGLKFRRLLWPRPEPVDHDGKIG